MEAQGLNAHERAVLAEVARRGDAMALREKYRRSLHAFVVDAWPHVESRPFVDGRHIHVICEALEEHTDATGDLVINVVPGCGKSWICSVLWPCWIWATRDPGHRFIATSYAEQATRRDAIRSRNLILSDWWRSLWPEIDIPMQNTHAAADWSTTQGGGRLSVPLDGQLTSRHCDTFIVDDPIKPAEAHAGRVEIENVHTWWLETVPTRVLPHGRRLIVMQRLHDRDLAGLAIERGAKHIVLPMRFESTHPLRSERDWRTEEGELLWPEGMGEDYVEAKQADMSAYAIAGQHQQRPRPDGGEVFGAATYCTLESIPTSGVTAGFGIDGAYSTKTSADYSVFVLLLRVNARPGEQPIFFVADLVRVQKSQPDFVALAKMRAAEWPGARGGWYTSSTERGNAELMTRLGLHVEAMPATTDKFSRAQAVSVAWNQGRIRVPRDAPWAEMFVTEMRSFTGIGDRHDDCVDAMAAAYDRLAPRTGVGDKYARFLRNVKALGREAMLP